MTCLLGMDEFIYFILSFKGLKMLVYVWIIHECIVSECSFCNIDLIYGFLFLI